MVDKVVISPPAMFARSGGGQYRDAQRPDLLV